MDANAVVLRHYGLEKRSNPILHALGVMLGGHVGTNALGRVAHHGSNIAEHLAHQGFQHGLIGSQISPTRLQSMKSLLGPEAVMPYEAAHHAATELIKRAPNPVARGAAITSALSQGHLMAGAPIVDPVRAAMQHELAGTAPVLRGENRLSALYAKAVSRMGDHTMTGMETGAQRALKHVTGLAPAAGAVAADMATTGQPLGALFHFGWNGMRQAAGHTSIGQNMVANEIKAGLSNQRLSRTKELITDHLVSPAFLDARRMGQHIYDKSPSLAADAHANFDALRALAQTTFAKPTPAAVSAPVGQARFVG